MTTWAGLTVYIGIFEIVEQVIWYNLVWVGLCLINREAVYEKCKLTQQFQIFLII